MAAAGRRHRVLFERFVRSYAEGRVLINSFVILYVMLYMIWTRKRNGMRKLVTDSLGVLTARTSKRTPITKIVGAIKFIRRTYRLLLAVTFISLINTVLLNWLMCIRTWKTIQLNHVHFWNYHRYRSSATLC